MKNILPFGAICIDHPGGKPAELMFIDWVWVETSEESLLEIKFELVELLVVLPLVLSCSDIVAGA